MRGVFFVGVPKSPDHMGISVPFSPGFFAPPASKPTAPIPATVPIKLLLVNKFLSFRGVWQEFSVAVVFFLSDITLSLKNCIYSPSSRPKVAKINTANNTKLSNFCGDRFWFCVDFLYGCPYPLSASQGLSAKLFCRTDAYRAQFPVSVFKQIINLCAF